MFCIFYVLNFVIKAKFTEQIRSSPVPQQRARHSVNAAAGKQEVTFAPEVPQLFGINANRLGNHRPGHRSVCELYKKLCCGHCVREGSAGVRFSREMDREQLSAGEHQTEVCKSSAYSFVGEIMGWLPRE